MKNPSIQRLLMSALVIVACCLQQAVLGQSRIISGKITDSKSQGLPDVSIMIKGTGKGTFTNNKGEFQLGGARAEETLLISILGYKSQEVVSSGVANVVVSLSDSSLTLNEVVVVGYGTEKKTSLTGAVTTVKGEQLEMIPTSALSNTLAGRIPGATVVNNSGFAGAPSSIQIRGLGTLGNNDPLYVVDGIVQSKVFFDALNPAEIESLNILKDAATASVYGSRGANGVILVQTRVGRKQKPTFSYMGTTSLQRTTRPLQNYTATQELQYRNDQATTFGNPLPSTPEMFAYFKDKSYSILDEIWVNPSTQQHDFSVNGGSEAITYYMLLGVNKASGSFKNVDYDRYNFRSNVNANINKYMKLSLNLSGNQRSSERFYWPYDDAESFTVADFYRATFNWTRLIPFYVDQQGNPTNDTKTGLPVTSGGWNPIELVQNGGYRNTVWRTMAGTGRFDFKIPGIEGLSTSLQFNYTANDKMNKNLILFNKSYKFQAQSGPNVYLPAPVIPSQMNIHNLSSSYEQISEAANFDHTSQLDWYLNYEKTIGLHRVTGLLVYEQQKNAGQALSGNASDLLTGTVDQIFNASTDPQKRFFNGSEFAQSRSSWVGRAHYEYNDKYIAEFSFRRDGSYIFPESTRWGFFPSGSAAWVVSKENFFKVPAITFLKLRGSVGLLGNDAISAFQFQSNYTAGSSYVFGNNLLNGIRAGTPPNPNITWEKALSYNGGLDFGLLDGKITGEFNYFYRHSYDVFQRRIRVVPGTYGASLSNENYVQIDVKGFEAALNYSNHIGDFRYSVGANMGFAKDKLVYIDQAAGIADWQNRIGHPNNRIQGYISEGIIRDPKVLASLPAGFIQWGAAPKMGVLLYKDIRGNSYTNNTPNGIIDGNDQDILSENAVPRINYGLSLRGDWHGIAIDALLQGVGAYDRMVSTINGGGVFQTGDRPYFALWTDHWTPDNPNSKYPRAGEWAGPYGAEASTFWLRNGAYMRLKNLNVSYNLPKKWISHARMQNARVFFNGSNLFVISGIKEMDPEQNTLDSYPIMKTFTGGINITF